MTMSSHNPVKHLRHVVKQQIHIMDVQSTNLQHLCNAVMSTWTKIWGMFPVPGSIYAMNNKCISEGKL